MESGLLLVGASTALRGVQMGLIGQVKALPFFLVLETMLLMAMDSGLLLDKVQTASQQVPMELLGPVEVLPFFLVLE